MKKKLGFMLAVGAFVLAFSGCISNVTLREMELESDASSQILNLKLVGGEEDNYWRGYSRHYKKLSAGSMSLFDMEKALIDGYFDETKPEYGYAVLEYASDMREGAMSYWGAAIVTIPLYFVGFPTDSADFNLTAKFSIYDSYGNLVKTFSKTDRFYRVAGIYYGKNPTKKAAKCFSALFTELFEAAAHQSRTINEALLAAGPITYQKDTDAVAKILKESSSSKSSSSSYYSSESSSSSTVESIKSTSKTLEQGMKTFNENLMNNLKNQPCGACGGNGNCKTCGGTGKYSGNECWVCHGSGVCTRCNGTGKAHSF